MRRCFPRSRYFFTRCCVCGIKNHSQTEWLAIWPPQLVGCSRSFSKSINHCNRKTTRVDSWVCEPGGWRGLQLPWVEKSNFEWNTSGRSREGWKGCIPHRFTKPEWHTLKLKISEIFLLNSNKFVPWNAFHLKMQQNVCFFGCWQLPEKYRLPD